MREQHEQVAAAVCRAVAELPDRNSPPDWPEAMLVTHDELRQIVTEAVGSYGVQVRAQALEEAATAVTQHDRKGRGWVRDSLWDTLSNEAGGRIRALTPRSTHA